MRANNEVLEQLRSWVTSAQLPEDGRLPPERELAERFRISRAELRKALAVMEAEGGVKRHVGRGTFLLRNELIQARASRRSRQRPRRSPI
jgi:DNA-binding GntR family transcriptional regulator